MAPESAYPVLQRLRILASRQHLCIVIALQHQGITGIQHGHHMRRDMARIGQYAQPPGAIGENKLHRLAGIVWNRKRMHANIAD